VRFDFFPLVPAPLDLWLPLPAMYASESEAYVRSCTEPLRLRGSRSAVFASLLHGHQLGQYTFNLEFRIRRHQ
jgi:hypothetical protein